MIIGLLNAYCKENEIVFKLDYKKYKKFVHDVWHNDQSQFVYIKNTP